MLVPGRLCAGAEDKKLINAENVQSLKAVTRSFVSTFHQQYKREFYINIQFDKSQNTKIHFISQLRTQKLEVILFELKSLS